MESTKRASRALPFLNIPGCYAATKWTKSSEWGRCRKPCGEPWEPFSMNEATRKQDHRPMKGRAPAICISWEVWTKSHGYRRIPRAGGPGFRCIECKGRTNYCCGDRVAAISPMSSTCHAGQARWTWNTCSGPGPSRALWHWEWMSAILFVCVQSNSNDLLS
jgi:hypothetical protein